MVAEIFALEYEVRYQVSENPGGAVAAESGYKGEEAWNRARLQAPLGRAPDSRRRGRRVRRNLDQAKTILDALIKREEKKRELVESEVTLQRIQMKYKVGSSEEEFFDSDDVANSRPNSRLVVVQNPPFTESKTGDDSCRECTARGQKACSS
ncbi:UNVERIFIED_CONTAM: hypothetical protein Scaly_0706500 [Sesamum calycinum]|uniref:Uncharacterized protein n=1 Tax=Sesamum calycinum TaxID=2727403 RepID=A0AAW2R7H9_9LAMI